MTISQQKLTVIFRIEAGCLGPQGISHVASFCKHAKAELEVLYPDFIDWHVTPRSDKSLPEISYSIGGRGLNRAQATRYLALFGHLIDEFEHAVFDHLPEIIDHYFGR